MKVSVLKVNIRIPDVDFEDHSEQTRMEVRRCVEEWSKIMDDFLREEGHRQRIDKYPMAEIEYWRERSSKLSTLFEQLQLPSAQQCIHWLKSNNCGEQVLVDFEDFFSELTKVHSEAKDNVKFLTTLERHFKNLANGSMTTIVETLPSLLNAVPPGKVVMLVMRSDYNHSVT